MNIAITGALLFCLVVLTLLVYKSLKDKESMSDDKPDDNDVVTQEDMQMSHVTDCVQVNLKTLLKASFAVKPATAHDKANRLLTNSELNAPIPVLNNGDVLSLVEGEKTVTGVLQNIPGDVAVYLITSCPKTQLRFDSTHDRNVFKTLVNSLSLEPLTDERKKELSDIRLSLVLRNVPVHLFTK